MKLAAGLFWFASAALAQSATWFDLSGEWRMSPDDRSEYAAPDLDDRSWATLTLPRGGQYFHGIRYWLRRRVDLPVGTNRRRLALTLGALQDVYEVYVNGRRIAATGSFDLFEDARIPPPRTFAIPADAAEANPSLQIALHVRGALFYHPHWRLPDTGPYLLTDQTSAPVSAGRQQLESRWIAISPHLVFGAIFGAIGVLSLLGWFSERERKELLRSQCEGRTLRLRPHSRHHYEVRERNRRSRQSMGAERRCYGGHGHSSRGEKLMRILFGLLFFSCLTCAQVRFQFGDDPLWADPNFDDSSWKAAAPDYFPIPSSASDGMVWLRYRVSVPPDANPLAVRTTREDADCLPAEVWVNGVLVGSQGRFPPQPEVRARCRTHVFDLPAGLVLPGGTAIVAWRGWIPPLLRTPLPYVYPLPFAVEIGARDHMRSRERNAIDTARVSLELELFLDLLELLAGLGLFGLWWRTRGGLPLLWFSLSVLFWAFNFLWIDALSFWRPDFSYTLYWWGVCYLSIPLNIAWFEFIGKSLPVPKWTIRALEAVGILWPILWFPLVLAVSPSPVLEAAGNVGTTLFGLQVAGQTALALWMMVRGSKDTRALACMLGLAGAANLLVDVLMVLPHYVLLSGQHLLTDNLTQIPVFAVMCYILLRRFWHAWRAKEELNAEFEAAREMQERLVPRAIAVPGFRIESAYHPARHVGGDFFRILPVANGSVLVVVGDVSGKGLSAAMTVAAIAGALDNEFSRDPAEVLTHLNRALLTRQSGGFVTCCAVRVELSGDATISNAGHLVPHSGGVELTVDAELPLGITGDAVYRETRIKLAPDYYLTFVSDGVVEAANVAGELFGFERMRDISGQSPQEIAEAACAWGQNDDITVLRVRRDA